MPKTVKGDVMPVLKLEDSGEIPALEMSPTKRAFYVNQITECFAISILRDAQLLSRAVKLPGIGSSKRLLWERTRSVMLDSFMRLFQLEDKQLTQGRWNAGSGPVIDVPTNVKQVSEPQKPVA